MSNSQVTRLPRVLHASEQTAPRSLAVEGGSPLLRGSVLVPEPGLSEWERRRETTLARCAAAVHACPSAVALTHESAAVLHGLSTPRLEPDIRLAVPSRPRRPRRPFAVAGTPGEGTRRRRREVSLIRSGRALDAADIEVVLGLPVTSLERTIVDCAMDLPVRESVIVVDSGLRRLCEPDRWTGSCRYDPQVVRSALLARLEAVPARRGVRRARAAISLGSPWAESPGESVLRWALAADGLPAPVLQHEVRVDDGMRRYFIDLAWPAAAVAVEFDGYSKYTGSDDLRSEKYREMRLAQAGWTVLRFDWHDLRSPEHVAGRVRQALRTSVRENPAPRDLRC